MSRKPAKAPQNTLTTKDAKITVRPVSASPVEIRADVPKVSLRLGVDPKQTALDEHKAAKDAADGKLTLRHILMSARILLIQVLALYRATDRTNVVQETTLYMMGTLLHVLFRYTEEIEKHPSYCFAGQNDLSSELGFFAWLAKPQAFKEPTKADIEADVREDAKRNYRHTTRFVLDHPDNELGVKLARLYHAAAVEVGVDLKPWRSERARLAAVRKAFVMATSKS